MTLKTTYILLSDGSELDPKFCDVICKRYQILTGEKPTRETGEPVDFVQAA